MTTETVLITGCSSGIGRATAETFLADDGWTVYATARDVEDVADLAEAGAETAELDVTEPGHVSRVVDRMIEEAGRIDCVVNNAGYGQYGPVEDVPIAKIDRQIDVNVYGPLRLIRAVLPQMREQDWGGTIVNVSSTSGYVSAPGTGVYSASKFALEALSDALRGEVDPDGVEVVVVEPGPVNTNFESRADREVESGLDRNEAVYGWLYELYEDASIVAGASPLAVEADRVATVIFDAAQVSNPKARYPVGPVARAMRYGRFLPDSVRDRFYGLARRLA